MATERDRKRDLIDEHIDKALRVEPVGAALTGRIVANVRARAESASFLARIPGVFLATIGSVVAASIVGLGYVAGTLDPTLFEVGGASDLTIMLFDNPQNVLEIL